MSGFRFSSSALNRDPGGQSSSSSLLSNPEYEEGTMVTEENSPVLHVTALDVL